MGVDAAFLLDVAGGEEYAFQSRPGRLFAFRDCGILTFGTVSEVGESPLFY